MKAEMGGMGDMVMDDEPDTDGNLCNDDEDDNGDDDGHNGDGEEDEEALANLTIH